MAGGRKRVAKKDVVTELEEEDEPVMKKGRQKLATKAQGDRESQIASKAALGKEIEEKQTEVEEEQMEVKKEPEEREEEDCASVTTKKIKRPRGRAAKPKKEVEEEKEEEVPLKIKKGKRGRGAVAKPQHGVEEEEEEEKTPPIVKKGRRGPAKASKVEEEEEEATPVIKKGRRGPAKASKVEEEEEEVTPVIKKGRRGPARASKVEEESDEKAPPLIKKGKKGPGKASKVKEEGDEKEPPVIKKGRRGPAKASKVEEEEEEEQQEEEEEEQEQQQQPKDSESAEQSASDGEPTIAAKASGGKNAKPGVSRGKKGATKATKADGKENTDTSNVSKKSGQKTGVERVVVMKGRVAVDALCPIAQQSHVYDDGDDIWDCMLNQTNIQFNNNKYYLIQLLEDDSCKMYSVWMRWGRVGANGQNSLQPCGSDLNKAMNVFMKKFSDKTKNDWHMRDCFEKVPGKYDLLKMDYSKGMDTLDTVAVVKKAKEKAAVECQLHPVVRAVIELICDVKRMEEAVVEMKYDANKAPLGKLTVEQIKAGYLALKRVDNLIQSAKYAMKDLVQACNDFYTRVPHYFGMKVPPLIRTKAEIKEKVALLEALGDIQAALSVLDRPIDVDTHPADQHYHSLKCDLTPLEKDSEEYKIVESYMKTTHARTHNQYTLELLEVMVCHKDSEYQHFKDVGNRMLLWHGSRMSNWAGILSQGLRVAPPEAPVTGYMFGKGIYFADMASKSANYCWANARNNVGFLLLSEVALGKSNELHQADYDANKLPKGCHSVKGCGRTAPESVNFTKLSDGTVVPMGPGVQVVSKNDTFHSLLYNEYIVYDPAQVRTRFLLKVQFNFK